MSKLTEFLAKAKIGEPLTHANMRVYPLHVQNGHERGYRTLDEALSLKLIEVLEVTEGGSVPTLMVRNTGDLPVLMVVGEQLIGAKQNRILNTSLLVPAHGDLTIPVSCVEQGRWSYTSRAFSASTRAAHYELRRVATDHVTSSLSTKASFETDQGQVWEEVTRKISTHGSRSRTRALEDMYEQTEDQLQEYLDAFAPVECEGILIEIDGQIVGGDIFDHHTTLRALWYKLLRSYASSALEKRLRRQAQAETETAQPPTSSAPGEDTQAFIAETQAVTEAVYESVGLGKDVRLSSESVSGSALLWEERPVHTSLFRAQKR